MKTKAKRMVAGAGRTARRGFTLIEVLVTLAIVAALVAVLFPIVLDQVNDADPTRTSRDLASIRTGIETFQLNVRPNVPGDLEDLTHKIVEGASGDLDIEGDEYSASDTLRWRGPYLDLATSEVNGGASTNGDAKETGFGGNIQLELLLYETTNDLQEGATGFVEGNADWVSVTILNLSETQFEEVNAVIDGDEDTPAAEGRLRFTDDRNADSSADDAAVFYLAVPYRN